MSIHFNHIPFDLVSVKNISRKQIKGKRFYQIEKNDGTHLSFPSITTILSDQEKPWLNEWKARLGKSKADKETRRCSERGEAVHDMIEQHLKNNDVTDKYDIKLRKMFNQSKPRLRKINNIKTQEDFMFSETLGMAGQVDCIGEYDGVLSIIDFKTSTNVKKKENIEDYFIQATAYAIMAFEMYGVAIEDIVIMIATEKGIGCSIYKEKIDKYYPKLVKRIQEFNKGMEEKNEV